jgi:hypothetical protein
MSNTKVARSRWYVKFSTTPELKAERKRKLQTMTQELYNELLANLSRTMRPGFCEPGEALNEAILIAMKKYNGEGSLKSFITRAAYLWALEQYKHYAKKQIAFTNLQTDQQFGDYLDSILCYTEDPRYVEAVDELFIQRIEQILYIRRGYPFNTPPETVRHAKQILNLCRTNSNLGKGIGIDEYDNAPENIDHRKKNPYHHRFGRRFHNHTAVRHELIQHLCEELGTDPKDVHRACAALRVSTLQALHEGWLPL